MQGLNQDAWKKLEYVKLGFRLEFEDDFVLTLPALLQLRREFSKVSQNLQPLVSDDVTLQLRHLFAGVVPTDPVVRRHQSKTPPPFVLQVPENLPLKLEAGDVFELHIVFWGEGRQLASAFARLMHHLGSQGLCQGQGEFILGGVVSCADDGTSQLIWREGETVWASPEWPLLSVDSTPGSCNQDMVLDFVTPARLMRKGRPLFRPNLAELFPYILRRVTGVSYAWSGVELLSDPALYMGQLPECCPDERLHWKDWRELQGDGTTQALGGVVGALAIPQEWLDIVGPVLKVGELLNLGKGAAFGAGAWRLR